MVTCAWFPAPGAIEQNDEEKKSTQADANRALSPTRISSEKFHENSYYSIIAEERTQKERERDVSGFC